MIRRIPYVLLLLAATGAAAAQAQEAKPVPRKIQPGRVESWALPSYKMVRSPFGPGGSIETIIRRKDELKLTEQQVTQLETIRKEEVARRQEEARSLIDLQSRAAAGLLDRTEFRDEMEKHGDAERVAGRAVRNRLERILTAEQLDQVNWPLMRRLPAGLKIHRGALDGYMDLDFPDYYFWAPGDDWWQSFLQRWSGDIL